MTSLLQPAAPAFAGLGWLPWRAAFVLAVVVLTVALITRWFRSTRALSSLAWEVALILGLYGAWQLVGSMRSADLDQALRAGLWVADVQRVLGIPSEAALQAPFLSHEWLVSLADSYYTGLHIPVFVVTLVWVLLRHRADWPFARTTTVLLTGSCLLIQMWPVAPPRLLPQLGVVDTALLNGRSVYDAIPGANQLSAMPSVHMAWAGAVALFVVVSARTRWRWLAVAYPVMTFAVVVITGNHFVLDGLVSVALLGAAAGLTMLVPSQRPRRLVQRLAKRGRSMTCDVDECSPAVN